MPSLRGFTPYILSFLNCFSTAVADASLHPRQTPDIPDYVTKYAPLVWLDTNELYFPSDIGSFILNTQLDLNFTPIAEPRDVDLTNLTLYNQVQDCEVNHFDECDLYLTSRVNVSSDPAWFHGVIPDSQGATNGAISSAVVVVDHGNEIVDAYYFYFYAFNLGETIGPANISGFVIPDGAIAGNHLGDWEHTMTRFRSGKPDTIWYSAHDSGNVYTYDAVTKNNSRYLVYSGVGGHPNFPVPGLHQRNLTIILLNDTTSQGYLWDPLKSAYYYTFTPTANNRSSTSPSAKNGTFQAAGSTPDAPTDWFYFVGKWGDKQYNDSNPIQFSFAGLEHTWDNGPTGPLDKDLNRTETCPDRVSPCSTTTTLPRASGTTSPSRTVTPTRTASVASTTAAGSGAAQSSGSTASSSSSGAAAGPTYYVKRNLVALGAVAALMV